MDDYSPITLGAMVIIMGFIIVRLLRTIDKLADKLEARAHVEYRTEGIQEEDASPNPQKDDDAKSWHDYN